MYFRGCTGTIVNSYDLLHLHMCAYCLPVMTADLGVAWKRCTLLRALLLLLLFIINAILLMWIMEASCSFIGACIEYGRGFCALWVWHVQTVGVTCVVGENVGVAYSDTEICSSQLHHRVTEWLGNVFCYSVGEFSYLYVDLLSLCFCQHETENLLFHSQQRTLLFFHIITWK